MEQMTRSFQVELKEEVAEVTPEDELRNLMNEHTST